jgi:hypothetical protein
MRNIVVVSYLGQGKPFLTVGFLRGVHISSDASSLLLSSDASSLLLGSDASSFL